MFLIADGNNLAWAGFHALRHSMPTDTAEQKARCALLGLTQSVLGLAIRGGGPPGGASPSPTSVTKLAVAFDQGRPLRRRATWPAYQTTRESDPNFRDNEAFILQAIDQFLAMATMLPISVLRGENTEADDLIASAALQNDGPVRIASTDRDFMQLLDERVSIYSPVKRLVITTENFEDVAAPRTADKTPVVFPRERYLDYRVASGDASDDLPGIPGLGTIGAARLLAVAGLDVYLAEPALATKALGRANARLLASLRDDAPAIVQRNRELMDLRAAAGRYPALDAMMRTGTWGEAGFRTWLADQRIAGVDANAAFRTMSALAGVATTADDPAMVQGALF